MLTHNPELLDSDVVARVAETLQSEKEVAFYVLVLSLGDVQVLDGTTRPARMKADLSTITATFANADLLKQIEPFVVDFKKLLWKLASSR